MSVSVWLPIVRSSDSQLKNRATEDATREMAFAADCNHSD